MSQHSKPQRFKQFPEGQNQVPSYIFFLFKKPFHSNVPH